MKQVFSGGNGGIYAINDAGDLLWFQHRGFTDGSFRWTDNNPRKVSVGWAMPQVFAGRFQDDEEIRQVDMRVGGHRNVNRSATEI